MKSRKHSSYELFFGLAAFVVGALLLLQALGIIVQAIWVFLWPIFLILLGLKLIASGSQDHSAGACCEDEACEMSEMDHEPMKPKTSKKMPSKAKKK